MQTMNDNEDSKDDDDDDETTRPISVKKQRFKDPVVPPGSGWPENDSHQLQVVLTSGGGREGRRCSV